MRGRKYILDNRRTFELENLTNADFILSLKRLLLVEPIRPPFINLLHERSGLVGSRGVS
jgi:hypothetical protein